MKEYLGRVQALRFFAAFFVLFAHVQHEVAMRIMPDVGFVQFRLIDGGIGVDIFFLVSGFIMYHISGDEFAKPGAAWQFARRRFLRVAPLYYLATLLILIAVAAAGDQVASGALSATQVAASFAFLPYPNEAGVVVPILKLGWTLNYEAYFYAVFALALLFSRGTGLAVVFGVILGVVTLVALVPGAPIAVVYWGQSITLEFLAGIAVAMVYRRGVRLSRWTGAALVVAGIGLAAFLRYAGYFAQLPRFAFHGIPAAAIVAGIVLAPFGTRHSMVMEAFELAGDASYALYLFHPFAIRLATVIWAFSGIDASPLLLIAVIMVVAILAAVAINLLVEKPFDRWLRHVVGRRAAPLRSAP